MYQQQEQVKEGLQEITLSTLVIELKVLCEMIIDFDNIKANGFDLTEGVKFQGWEEFFNHPKGPVYPDLAK